MVVRILLTDGHPIVRLGLRVVLEQDSSLRVVGEADSVAQAELLIASTAPHVVVTGLGLADRDGPAAVAALVALAPTASVLVVTGRSDGATVIGALEAGAAGYILKRRAPADVRDGVRRVAAGQRALDPELVGVVVSRALEPAQPAGGRLSDRELEVLRLLGQGATSKEIAASLGLQPKTVENHRARLLDKLGAANSAAAVRMAIANGLLAAGAAGD